MANVSILGVRWLDSAPSQTKRPFRFFPPFVRIVFAAIDRPPGDVFPLQFLSNPIEKKTKYIYKLVLKVKTLLLFALNASQMNAIQHPNLHFSR
jgi:hypothetical protein